MDGFRANYLSTFPDNTTLLRNLASQGVWPPFMRSVFPSKTFPNHYTIVTGMYPESHGIVGNRFYDKELNETYVYQESTAYDTHWWLEEPIWVTAGKAGLTTGVFFWPGSEVPVKGVYPTYYMPYSGRVLFEQRVKTVLSWLDLPQNSRPQFMGLYFSEPDSTGHRYGPDSPQVGVAQDMQIINVLCL